MLHNKYSYFQVFNIGYIGETSHSRFRPGRAVAQHHDDWPTTSVGVQCHIICSQTAVHIRKKHIYRRHGIESCWKENFMQKAVICLIGS